MSTATRIYVVRASTAASVVAVRLVRAASQAQAVNHVVRLVYRASLPSTDQLVELIQAGTAVEDAGPAKSDEGDAA